MVTTRLSAKKNRDSGTTPSSSGEREGSGGGALFDPSWRLVMLSTQWPHAVLILGLDRGNIPRTLAFAALFWPAAFLAPEARGRGLL